MSAVGDSATSKYRTSPIKQATLIPALCSSDLERGLQRNPQFSSTLFSHSPRAWAPALPSPSPRVLMPREPAKHRRHTMFNYAAFLPSKSAGSERGRAQRRRRFSSLNRQEITKPTQAQTHRKRNVMSKQLAEKDGHLSIKMQCG